jgi:peptide deformylase
VLRYRDEQFVEHTERIEGFTAVIFQHEIDHLHGRLFVDYLSEEAFDEAIEE